ncbi:LON peptidase substrate-binding domain-containing protein [Deinococcus aquaedulcis]|uniref:LON peptidase substrate-binding domain-containing protein n=1 Tax=Deinococcus aquaedulcis TaxID=2840455 RepID=UPI001C82AE6A|nr:LON peptidase substrate-binding domain-containing protein [Deinococcus aquaedulcis]
MRVPLFPLPKLVLFPGVLLPLYVFEPRYRALLADVQASGGPFGIVRIVVSSEESDRPFHERVSRVGTLASLRQAQGHEDGTSTILVTGGERFEIERFHFDQPYLSADVRLWPLEGSDAEVERVSASELLSALIRLRPEEGEALRRAAPSEPLLLASFAAASLPLTPEQREDALRAPTLGDRLDVLLGYVPREAKLLN